MPTLGETQLFFREALVQADTTRVEPLLAGYPNPRKGLGIHQRNYQSSLMLALLTKFPATVWLAGTAFTEAAELFIKEHPPQKPCIAEYGNEFPEFLASLPAGERMPYLKDFALLESLVGNVSVEIDVPWLALQDFSLIDKERLAEAVLRLQPGLRYQKASWPMDDLLKLYLTDTAPNQYVLEPFDVWLEVRGARGGFTIDRLDASEFVFRKSISQGTSIGAAADLAFHANPKFNLGEAFARLINGRLMTGLFIPNSSVF